MMTFRRDCNNSECCTLWRVFVTIERLIVVYAPPLQSPYSLYELFNYSQTLQWRHKGKCESVCVCEAVLPVSEVIGQEVEDMPFCHYFSYLSYCRAMKTSSCLSPPCRVGAGA